jgi:hypothetical protein
MRIGELFGLACMMSQEAEVSPHQLSQLGKSAGCRRVVCDKEAAFAALDHFPSPGTASCLVFPDNLTFDHVDNVLGYIRGMVGYPLKVTRDKHMMEQSVNLVRVLPYRLLSLGDYFPFDFIHLIVGGHNLSRQIGIHIDKRVEALFEHCFGLSGHLSIIEGNVGPRGGNGVNGRARLIHDP